MLNAANAQEIQPRSVKFGLRHRYWGRNMDNSYEPESKQQSTVWVFQNEPKPTKVVRSRSAAKQMIACFFGYTGHVTTVALEDCKY